MMSRMYIQVAGRVALRSTSPLAGSSILVTKNSPQDSASAASAAGSRCFATSPTSNARKNYKLLVVGAGTGGSAIASTFASKLGKGNVAVLDSSAVHYNQTMFTLVGAGIRPFNQTHEDTGKILPKDCDWIRDMAAGFDPDNNTVTTASGDVITYDFIVVALGVQLNYGQIEGLTEALKNDPRVCSNYSPVYVKKTMPAAEQFKGGNAIFTMPPMPIKCPGAPQKICYLIEDYFRRTNKRDSATVMYNSSLPVLFGIPRYADSLWKVVKERNIDVNLQHRLIEVRPETSEAVFEIVGSEPREFKTFKYSMLHASPPCSAPTVLQDTPLVDQTGYVDVDRSSLQHVKYPNVFAIGDCANLPTSKTAASVASQSGIVGKNLQRVMDGKETMKTYEGYTSCPLLVSNKACILAEFGYDGKILETFPINQAKPRRSMYHVKVDILPKVYFRMLVKGWWHGPTGVRKMLRLGRAD